MNLERTHTDRTFPSSVALPQDKRVALIDQLNVVLGSTLDLYSQVKQAHWNIKGPQFYARHLLFDELAARLRTAADDIAERASTLGGYAKGTIRLAAASSKIDEYDQRAVAGPDHVRALVARYARYTACVRESAEAARETGDPTTEDLYIEILRGTEKDLWFLESQVNI